MEHHGEITFREVTGDNWRETLELSVRPEQQRFISDYAPIAALALAKAYIRPGDMTWIPYAVYAGATMVGFFALAYRPETNDQYWLFHFFIDQRYQERGYGRAAMQRLIELIGRVYSQCQTLHLTDKGYAALVVARECIDEHEKWLKARFSPGETALLIELLSRIHGQDFSNDS